MKKIYEILEKCSQYEQLAALGAEIPIIERPTVPIPRPPPLPRPAIPPPPLVEPTARPTVRPPPLPRPAIRPPPMETPVVETPTAKVAPREVVAPKEPAKTTVVDPKTLQPVPEASLDIKFDEHGNVVIPDKWVDAKGKLTVNKKQLAEAIHKARKAKIVRQKLDAAKAKTLSREMSQVNRMVGRIAFREKLPMRAGLALLTVAALSVVYYIISGKKATSSDSTKSQVINDSTNAVSETAAASSAELLSSIGTLSTALSAIEAKNDKTRQVLQNYSTLLNNISSSVQKLSGNLNLDSTQSAAVYAAEIQNFDKLAVEASDKLEKLETVFKNQGKNDLAEKTEQVRFTLETYIVSIEGARAIKNQGVSQ